MEKNKEELIGMSVVIRQTSVEYNGRFKGKTGVITKISPKSIANPLYGVTFQDEYNNRSSFGAYWFAATNCEEIINAPAKKTKKPVAKSMSVPGIVGLTKNGIATIVFWEDGSKTIVKKQADTEDDIYSAVTAAITIKLFGSNSALKTFVEKNLKEQKPKKKKTHSPSRYRKPNRMG